MPIPALPPDQIPVKVTDKSSGPESKPEEAEPASKLEVKEEDTILFSKYGGQEIRVDGEDHLVLREDDSPGIINE